jgi:formate dehydrogenase gamma subunit
MVSSIRRLIANVLSIIAALSLLVIWTGRTGAQTIEDCGLCHADASLFEGNPRAAELTVKVDVYAASVHGRLGMVCTDCHQDLAGVTDFPHAETLQKVACGTCHDTVAEVYARSLHGWAQERGNTRAPSCASCHTTHDILPASNPESSISKARLPETCSTGCHGLGGLLEDSIVKLPESFQDYNMSVHGRGTRHGVEAAASCDDCHEVHDLKSSADPTSPINQRNVAGTCGQCHGGVQRMYDDSIHGRAVQAGVTDSPTCTDCHGEHLILRPSDPESKTYVSRIAAETCGRCHQDPIIIHKYGLKGGVVGSYEDSYHGWAVQRNHKNAATCISCHTAHEVLPERDPDSTVNPANVVSTCQQCHPNVDEKFAASYTHTSASLVLNPINWWIRNVYLVLIVLIIGGMVVHNLVIMNYYMIESRRAQEVHSWVMRFDLQQVIQHLLLTLAFVTLVVTGFALRFPDAWWVKMLAGLGLDETTRALIHRIAAVLMVVTALYHMWYIFATRRGRGELRAMLPAFSDVRDLFENFRFHTWRSRREVKFGRYDYSQKAEYWALIWGTIAMILTGLVLWFPGSAVKILPAWAVPASQTIHYYEAWLATLAILVWHFFFVIFHPEEYPMSWTWLTGRMSEHAVRKHHARWYEEEIAAPSLSRSEGNPTGADRDEKATRP